MATIEVSRTATGTSAAFVASWTPLAQGDSGQALPHSQYSDKSVQVFGTFGGASVAVEGSNNGTVWATLTDPQGNDLLITAAKIEMVTEATAFIRPRVVGGDGSTSLTVAMLCKEAR
jgi:hypothetical protein